MKHSFIQYFSKTELRKYINYTFFNHYFDEQVKVKCINTLDSKRLIFTVIVPNGKHLFNSSESSFRFMDCFVNKKGNMQATFSCSIAYHDTGLKAILRQIDFFRRFPKDAIKMKFPDINLKQTIEL